MDVDVTKTPNHTECIRCGMCVRACPTDAVHFRYGFGNGKYKITVAETPLKINNLKEEKKGMNLKKMKKKWVKLVN